VVGADSWGSYSGAKNWAGVRTVVGAKSGSGTVGQSWCGSGDPDSGVGDANVSFADAGVGSVDALGVSGHLTQVAEAAKNVRGLRGDGGCGQSGGSVGYSRSGQTSVESAAEHGSGGTVGQSGGGTVG
jgi:hypothetical protein